jgi:hypothetical protein
MEGEIARPSLISGSSPAGRVSVTMQMNPVMASASKAPMGRLLGAADKVIEGVTGNSLSLEILTYVSIDIKYWRHRMRVVNDLCID